MSKNIITAIQARPASQRLPKKVLMPLCGKPLLIMMVERIQRAKLAGTIVIATSDLSQDDIIEDLCAAEGIRCFRGDHADLLDRHYKLAVEYQADALVKIPSDCPLVDPLVIDHVIGHYLDHFPDFDYVSNLHPASWPDGNDVEIMSMDTLKTAWEKSNRDFEREHTTPYIWENPSIFRIGNVTWQMGDFSASHRWTIDYPEDYHFIRAVFDRLYPDNPEFKLEDILFLLEEHSEIRALNQLHAGHYWYDNHLDELTNIEEYKLKLKKHES